jgi:hypothetical protein
MVVWVVTPCSLDRAQCFGGTQSGKKLFDPEDGDDVFPQNMGFLQPTMCYNTEDLKINSQ